MAIKSQHTFIGLDTDIADRFVKEGSFRDSLNIHIGSSENDSIFSVENIKGNSIVSYTLPSGTNKIIGSHEDITNRCIYYFLCNSSTLNIQSTSGVQITTTTNHGLVLTDLITVNSAGARTNILGDWIVQPTGATTLEVLNPLTYVDSTYQTMTSALLPGTSGATGTITKYAHSILKYNSVTNTISLVYKHSRLNFKSDYPITGTAYLNNILHWIDGYNPPRSLDQSVISVAGSYFIESLVDFIKIPPTEPAQVIGKWVDSNGTEIPYVTPNSITNHMDDKAYQFTYRYVYSDNTTSVWADFSETIATGYANAKINKIEITIPLPMFYGYVVKSIEIAFRDSVLTNFKFIDRLTSNPYNFYNDVAYSVIDVAETNKPFDSVPKVAGALDSVQNRVFMGDCTEGFDVDPTTFSAINVVSEGTLSSNSIVWKADEPYDVGIVFCDRAERQSGVYKLFRINMGDNIAPTFSMQGVPPIWATHYKIVRSSLLSKSYFIQGYFVIVKVDVSDKKTSILFNSINGKLNYDAQPGDILKINSGNPEEDKYEVKEISADKFGNSIIIVKGIIPQTPNNAIGNLNFVPCEIYSPIQSRDQFYYETPYKFPILNPGSPQRTFVGTLGTGTQIRLRDYVSGDVYYRNLNDALPYHARMIIHIESLDRLVNNRFTITFSNGYSFIANRPASGVDFAERSLAEDFVEQINRSKFFKAFMLMSNYVDINDLENGNPTGMVVPVARFVVYDTRKGINGNMTLTSSTSQFIPAVPPFFPLNRTVGVTQGANSRVGPTGAQNFINNNFVYSMSANDKNLTWDSNIGRSNIVLVNGDKQIRRNIIRYGGRFLTETSINFVNTFNSTDYEPLTNFGLIRKLISASNNSAEGTILLVVQENDISSCYIGQAIIKNADGSNQLVSTDKVIGTINPLQKLVGTVNPESVVQYNGLVYGFDALKGIVWRYGQDGLNFISEVGMKNFFYQRSLYLLSLGTSFKCYAGIDPYHNEYIITIPNTDTEKKTIAWSEALNRWTSFFSFAAEGYQKVNVNFVSFLNGALWLHRSNNLFNNFYGTQYKSKLKMICNQEPDLTKILHTIEQKSTSVWDCVEITTPEGQESELVGLFDISTPNTYPQDFRKYDNTTYSASVMRDKNTPNMQTSDYPLLNGDLIRSDVFFVNMENSKTTQENLYFVNLMYIPSYKKS